MPGRIERATIRWLLRAFLLALITIAVWNSLYQQRFPATGRSGRPADLLRVNDAAVLDQGLKGGNASGDPVSELDAWEEPPGRVDAAAEPAGVGGVDGEVNSVKVERGNALVVASLKGDDTSWLNSVLEGWERNIYVANGDALGGKGKLRIPQNKGREGMIYLSFIIDNYDNLPNVTLFLHSARYQWHNDDPIYDGVPMLQNFRISHVLDEGYANLRCGWTLGCPSEIQPSRHLSDSERTETYYVNAFQTLFPHSPVPDVVGVGCCAQFAATRLQIRSHPLSDYYRYRQWLLDTPLKDDISGRIMEYSWHMIFGRPAVHCPPAGDCYCKTYGYCDLNCTQDACEGRYTLPPYSTMPEGWPEKGWGN